MMTFEHEIFKRLKPNTKELIKYGFVQQEQSYVYEKLFLNNTFKAIIVVGNDNVLGKVIECEFNEEYANFRMENNIGSFATKVRNEYLDLLSDIALHCFEKLPFIFEQSNRINNLIYQNYQCVPEFLWDAYPNYCVYRNTRSEKWFAALMNIDKNKLIKNESGEIEVVDVKLDDQVPYYLTQKGIYPAYHMSKKNWVSIILDNTLTDSEIMKLISISYQQSNISGEWIIPANPHYYNVFDAFAKSDVILWKQSNNNIKVGDIVYLYLAKPYSAIMFQCKVTKTNIPYHYQDENLSMKYVMEIKLLQKYNNQQFSLDVLNQYGIKTIRGPIKTPQKLSVGLNKKNPI